MREQNQKTLDKSTPSGCISCRDDQVRLNSNVNLISSYSRTNVELYRCRKCHAYFEYKDDAIRYMSDQKVWSVYGIDPEQSIMPYDKTFIMYFAWMIIWGLIIWKFEFLYGVPLMLGGLFLIHGFNSIQNRKYFR